MKAKWKPIASIPDYEYVQAYSKAYHDGVGADMKGVMTVMYTPDKNNGSGIYINDSGDRVFWHFSHWKTIMPPTERELADAR